VALLVVVDCSEAVTMLVLVVFFSTTQSLYSPGVHTAINKISVRR